MTSGESCVLALTKEDAKDQEDVVREWRYDLIESEDESLRAEYATNQILNALHSSDSSDAAMRELAFFFPQGHRASVSEDDLQRAPVQRTLALIRPAALAQHGDAIIKKIREHGFEIAMMKKVQLDRKQAEDFYVEHKNQPFFENLVTEMTR